MDGGISTLRRGEPPARDILAALETVLASESLRLSERNRRFLAFVVTQKVEGHGDRIKAYSIGVDVFGRDGTFDPTLDPIVRIEATRLRSALTAYYDDSGATDLIRISIPPGSYVPTFSWAPPEAGKQSGKQSAGSSEAALPVTIVVTDQSAKLDAEVALRSGLFVDGLVRLLSRARFKVYVVPSAERRAALEAIHEVFDHPGEAYSLDVAVRPMSEHRRYSWRFSDLRDGEVLSCDFRDFAASATPCFALIDDLAEFAADAIATALVARQ